MDGNLLANVLQTAGVGGALALVMFHFYRKDAKTWLHRHNEQMTSMLRRHDDQMTLITKLHSEAMTVIKDNTTAVTKLEARLEHVVGVAIENGRH